MYSVPLKPRWPEVEEFLALSALIHQIHLSASSSDFRAWSLSPSEIFSVSSFFLAPNSPFPDFPYTHKTMWFALTPWKVQAFLWKIAWSRTPNWDVIQSFYPQFPFVQTFVPFAYRRLNPMSTCFFTVFLFGNCGATSFKWSMSAGWYRATVCTASSPGKMYCSAGNQGTYGFYVFMLSFGRFGRNAIGVCLKYFRGCIFSLGVHFCSL